MSNTLYVGGLEANVDEAILHGAFIPFGEVTDVQVPLDRQTGKHRGFGFVTFELAEDARAALENMNHAEIFGRVLKVSVAKEHAGPRDKAIWEDEAYYKAKAEEEKHNPSSPTSTAGDHHGTQTLVSEQAEGEGFRTADETEGAKTAFFVPKGM